MLNFGGSSTDSIVTGYPGQPARQRRMVQLWEHFDCTNYERREFDHDGRSISAMASGGCPSPASYKTAPLYTRRPAVAYALPRIVVKKYSDLLFNSYTKPAVKSIDEDTEAWCRAFVKDSNLWARAYHARMKGGACGSVAMGLMLFDGVPYIDVMDPRFCTPTFSNPFTKKLKTLELKYQYRDTVGGDKFWYRRIVDETYDRTWPGVPVGDAEPIWESLPSEDVEHRFGEHPYVWIQNTQSDEIDGDADCHGAYSYFEAIDQLQSEGFRGTRADSNPTPVISSADGNAGSELVKGTGGGFEVGPGGKATYLEMTGTGIKTGMDLVSEYERQVGMITGCVFEQRDTGSGRTVAEVERSYNAMHSTADTLRDQYGTGGVLELLKKAMRIERRFKGGHADYEDADQRGTKVQPTIQLSKRTVLGSEDLTELEEGLSEEAKEAGSLYKEVENVLGESDNVTLKWPTYIPPGINSVLAATQAGGEAYTAGTVPLHNVVTFLSDYYGVEDTHQAVREINAERLRKMEEDAMVGASAYNGAVGAVLGGDPAKSAQAKMVSRRNPDVVDTGNSGGQNKAER